MKQDDGKRIGLVVGREKEWSDAFITAVNNTNNGVTAELARLGGTRMDESCPYDVIVDRVSHEIPYYRARLQHAALYGSTIINNPFTWPADNKFFGIALASKMGFITPRTIVLPNKHVEKEMTPDSFRNLVYPMDWKGIIDYVGVPAVFKSISSGGRNVTHRVHNVDDLIQRYDESGTMTMILQEIIETDTHIHCFVFGQETVMALRYSVADRCYFPDIWAADDALGQELIHQAQTLTRAYGYDVNMVEFALKDDQLYIINSTNPAPVMNRSLMTPEQFDHSVNEVAQLAMARALRPLPQRSIFDRTHDKA